MRRRSQNGERRIGGERYILRWGAEWTQENEARRLAAQLRTNGCRVRILKRDRLPLSCIDVYVHAGDWLDSVVAPS